MTRTQEAALEAVPTLAHLVEDGTPRANVDARELGMRCDEAFLRRDKLKQHRRGWGLHLKRPLRLGSHKVLNDMGHAGHMDVHHSPPPSSTVPEQFRRKVSPNTDPSTLESTPMHPPHRSEPKNTEMDAMIPLVSLSTMSDQKATSLHKVCLHFVFILFSSLRLFSGRCDLGLSCRCCGWTWSLPCSFA